jgi:hypothetical protein
LTSHRHALGGTDGAPVISARDTGADLATSVSSRRRPDTTGSACRASYRLFPGRPASSRSLPITARSACSQATPGPSPAGRQDTTLADPAGRERHTGRSAVCFRAATIRHPTADRIAEAIRSAVQRFETRGSTEQMAQGLGDHPDAAAERMRRARQLAAANAASPHPTVAIPATILLTGAATSCRCAATRPTAPPAPPAATARPAPERVPAPPG